MSTYNRAIYHDAFHIRVIGKMSVHPRPNTFVAPPDKTFMALIGFRVDSQQLAPT